MRNKKHGVARYSCPGKDGDINFHASTPLIDEVVSMIDTSTVLADSGMRRYGFGAEAILVLTFNTP